MMEEKTLKSYKGFSIEKSYEINHNGTIKKDTVLYTAFTEDGGLFDGDKTLAGLKKKLDNYTE